MPWDRAGPSSVLCFPRDVAAGAAGPEHPSIHPSALGVTGAGTAGCECRRAGTAGRGWLEIWCPLVGPGPRPQETFPWNAALHNSIFCLCLVLDATTVVAWTTTLKNVVYLRSQRSAITVRASCTWWLTAPIKLSRSSPLVLREDTKPNHSLPHLPS